MINGINLQFSLQLFFRNVQSTSEENKSKERCGSSERTPGIFLTQTASCNIYLSVTNVCIYSQSYDKILLSSTPTGAI